MASIPPASSEDTASTHISVKAALLTLFSTGSGVATFALSSMADAHPALAVLAGAGAATGAWKFWDGVIR